MSVPQGVCIPQLTYDTHRVPSAHAIDATATNSCSVWRCVHHDPSNSRQTLDRPPNVCVSYIDWRITYTLIKATADRQTAVGTHQSAAHGGACSRSIRRPIRKARRSVAIHMYSKAGCDTIHKQRCDDPSTHIGRSREHANRTPQRHSEHPRAAEPVCTARDTGPTHTPHIGSMRVGGTAEPVCTAHHSEHTHTPHIGGSSRRPRRLPRFFFFLSSSGLMCGTTPAPAMSARMRASSSSSERTA